LFRVPELNDEILLPQKELKTEMHALSDTKGGRFEDAGHFIPEEEPEELIVGIKNLIRS